jgi:porphobilinogen synthase
MRSCCGDRCEPAPHRTRMTDMSQFPQYRPRRLRRTPALRRLVRETTVQVEDLILPLFVVPGSGVRREVGSMPGVFQTSLDEMLEDARTAAGLGVPAVLLFGIPATKDAEGTSGHAEGGVVQQAVRALKRDLPDLVVITDVCLCEYTSHGHCGVLRDGAVDNDATLELLARQALSHAQAGADVVAPSDMMDGRVAAIRTVLDNAGFHDVAILSYAAKYASAFYGPFRDAAESTPQSGDRHGYQMDPGNAEEALREVRLDVAEGADMLMVKPAHACLDIIWRVKQETGYPLAAYHVSGEYASILAAGRLGWLDADRAMAEALTAIRRAGADLIVTYWAVEFARKRRNGEL